MNRQFFWLYGEAGKSYCRWCFYTIPAKYSLATGVYDKCGLCDKKALTGLCTLCIATAMEQKHSLMGIPI